MKSSITKSSSITSKETLALTFSSALEVQVILQLPLATGVTIPLTTVATSSFDDVHVNCVFGVAVAVGLDQEYKLLLMQIQFLKLNNS